jgi:hypothetical protein
MRVKCEPTLEIEGERYLLTDMESMEFEPFKTLISFVDDVHTLKRIRQYVVSSTQKRAYIDNLLESLSWGQK